MRMRSGLRVRMRRIFPSRRGIGMDRMLCGRLVFLGEGFLLVRLRIGSIYFPMFLPQPFFNLPLEKCTLIMICILGNKYYDYKI